MDGVMGGQGDKGGKEEGGDGTEQEDAMQQEEEEEEEDAMQQEEEEEEKPYPVFPAEEGPNKEEGRARLALFAHMRAHNQVALPSEWGIWRYARGIQVEGFAVHCGDKNGFIYSLLNPTGKTFAKTMVPAELFRHSLCLVMRIDISMWVGHWSRWEGGVGMMDNEEREHCIESAGLIVACGFSTIVSMGNQARTFLTMALEDQYGQAAQQNEAEASNVSFYSSFSSSSSSSSSSSRSITLVSFVHPTLCLPGKAVDAPIALKFAGALDTFVLAYTGAAPRYSVHAWAKKAGDGLSCEHFSELDLSRSLRAWELFTKKAILLHKCPDFVPQRLLLDTGGKVKTHKDFVAMGWKPQKKKTREPYSPICWFLSQMGQEGGR